MEVLMTRVVWSGLVWEDRPGAGEKCSTSYNELLLFLSQ